MKLPILLNYSGTHTHRWSGGNKMNLQNLKRGGELRRSILAPKGHVIVVADSAQIEARVLAWLAQQMDIVNAFANKDDVYKLMASAIYGIPVEQVTKDQRFIGKICVLGLGYGMGPNKLQQTLKQGTMGPPVDISLEECRRIVNIYRSRNYKIRQLWKIMDGIIASMITGARGEFGPLTYGKGYIQLPNGLFLQYYGLHGETEVYHDDLVVHEATYLTRNGRTKIYGGLLTENVVQALARCIIADQMLEISKKYRIVTMTHDEIVVVCPKKDADRCLRDMIHIMSTAPEWAEGLPLAAEGGWDINYSK
jgi:DNA polymerase